MNKLLLTSFVFALAFIGFASAEYFPCSTPGYNMYSFSMPSMNFESQRFLDSQNFVSSSCCETPVYNNYDAQRVMREKIINLDSQNYVPNDCCGAPIYNNYQAETKTSSPRTIYLDSFNFKPCCTN